MMIVIIIISHMVYHIKYIGYNTSWLMEWIDQYKAWIVSTVCPGNIWFIFRIPLMYDISFYSTVLNGKKRLAVSNVAADDPLVESLPAIADHLKAGYKGKLVHNSCFTL